MQYCFKQDHLGSFCQIEMKLLAYLSKRLWLWRESYMNISQQQNQMLSLVSDTVSLKTSSR
jgi:hypothetical protein